jgi:glyoxalase family protein
MNTKPTGIHHVTAIGGDPQRNVDFYVGVLGLRLIKKTVNFDDPGTYHLYYGDEVGTPGTVMTFFPWAHAPRGRRGAGQVVATAFSVARGALPFWEERLRENGVSVAQRIGRFGEEGFAFEDPDGLLLEILAPADTDTREGWADGPVPAENAIKGFAGATLLERDRRRTEELLTGVLGFRVVGEDGNRFRYEIGDGEGEPATVLDVVEDPDAGRGNPVVGTVHHIAFRIPDEETERALREEVASLGYNVTPVLDRNYFRSIYFREPGGVLFEIATDVPGFTVDEPVEELGKNLKLPPQYESRRGQLEQKLMPIELPHFGKGARA